METLLGPPGGEKKNKSLRLRNHKRGHGRHKSDELVREKNDSLAPVSASANLREKNDSLTSDSANSPTCGPSLGLADLLLLLHEKALPMGPDRGEFSQNLARTITQVIDRQRAPSRLPLPHAGARDYVFPRGRPVQPEPTQDHEGEVASGTSFNDIINTPELARAFHSFLAKAYCHETLEFYDMVDEFRYTWPHDTDSLSSDERRSMTESAHHIWHHFIEPGAELQVNVDEHLVQDIECRLESPSTHMFDEAQSAVRVLMVDGLFSRFLQSPEYKNARELIEVRDAIDREHACIRELLLKVADSERQLMRLEERQRELTQAGRPADAAGPAAPSSGLGGRKSTGSDNAASGSAASAEPMMSSPQLRQSRRSPWSVTGILPGPRREKRRSKSQEQLVMMTMHNKPKQASKRFWQAKGEATAPAADWVLVVAVIQLKDLVLRDREGEGGNLYVEVKFGRQKVQTNPANRAEPRWREYFCCPVGKQDEAHKVSVTLYNLASGTSAHAIGRVKFSSLQEFTTKTERWHELHPKKDPEAVVGKLRLLTHYRPQETRERELRKTMKHLNRFISEEEDEIKEDQWKKKRQMSTRSPWSSLEDLSTVTAPDPSSSAASLSPRGQPKTNWRHSALVILPMGFTSSPSPSEGGATGRVLKSLFEHRAKLERELLLLDVERHKASAPGSQREPKRDSSANKSVEKLRAAELPLLRVSEPDPPTSTSRLNNSGSGKPRRGSCD